ncbi:hypothetical protein B0H16DRAFT_1814911 [Mycena metata]|uniref:Uncharacterized protein n=1 Tax=Mycena metata TaxID=1033252 RepID=A0AAD7H4Z6_9AGAR|nr:hypothetical protein B0H16DRAFT_1814911 [Mycena metata]
MSFSRSCFTFQRPPCTLFPTHNPGSGVLAGVGRVFSERYRRCWAAYSRCYCAPVLSLRSCLPSEHLPHLPGVLPPFFCNTLPSAISCTKYSIPGCHDDPEEKRQDAIRAEINAGHRFDIFAAERSENSVQWHIDGHDYVWALSETIDNAREVIFIERLGDDDDDHLTALPFLHPLGRARTTVFLSLRASHLTPIPPLRAR